MTDTGELRLGAIMDAKERAAFDQWVSDLKAGSEGRDITLVALYQNNQLLKKILDLKRGDLAITKENLLQLAGLITKILS